MRTLYRHGNMTEAWGIKFAYMEFADDEVDAAIECGWVRNPLELKPKDEKKQPADNNGDGKLSAEEAKVYLDSIGVDYSGLHWKKVVALAEQHQGKE